MIIIHLAANNRVLSGISSKAREISTIPAIIFISLAQKDR
jgi:hypothetical protein